MFKFLEKFSLGKKVLGLFQKKVDESTLDELERLFFEADLGSELACLLADKSRTLLRKEPDTPPELLLKSLEDELITRLPPSVSHNYEKKPHVIFIIGVNGSGKTTSVAKLAHFYKKQKKEVLIAAGDTFRAAAIDQLEIWAKRAGVDIIKGKPMGDPAAVAFDAIQAGLSRGADIVIVDTAGRLHTRDDLMGELEKMKRVASKSMPGAPHETLLVLDATIGQNALTQAQVFNGILPLSGLILTKLDGTAKGGAAIALQQKLKLPIAYMGTGEKLDDFAPFDPKAFIHALFS